jgi:hypothetical protein
MNQCKDLPQSAFSARSGRFSASMYEAIFAAVCEGAFSHKTLEVNPIDATKLDQLKNDEQFVEASQSRTTSKENVALRLQRAKQILLS